MQDQAEFFPHSIPLPFEFIPFRDKHFRQLPALSAEAAFGWRGRLG